MIKYRPDIDGLRGIAVLLVVLFHAGLPYLSGGFIGVDIFFVISGYLITSIILSDVKQDKFSFVSFYERRIRRILPALYVMAALVLLVTLFVQVPLDLTKTAKTLLFATLFSSNIFFWRTTDYFSGDSDFEFFLHTWSLGVEEQFYFIFPVIILLFAKRGHWLLTLAIVALIFSFLISVYTSYYHQWASYYLLPSRAWQMMMGSILAIISVRMVANKNLVGLTGIIAVLLIAVPAIYYTKQTRFPGVAAFLPTLGAALVILLGFINNDNWLTRLLATSWLKFIGLLSYSLYLWHWPVFAFLRNYHADVRLSLGASLLGVALSFLLAYVSWKWVEAPFRNKARFSRRAVYILAGMSSLLILGTCLVIITLKGIPSRIDSTIIQLSQVSESGVIGHPCMNKTSNDILQGDFCYVGGEDTSSPSIALWGDSHLGALKQTLSLRLQEQEKSAAFFAKVGCPPLIGVMKTNLGDGQQCVDFNNSVLSSIVSTSSIHTVVLHARWALSVEGTRYASEAGPNYVLTDTLSTEHGLSNADVVSRGMLRTVDRLQEAGKRIVIIAGVPEIGSPVPKVLANNLFWGKARDIRPSIKDYQNRQAVTNGILGTIKSTYPDITIVDPSKVLCTTQHCQIVLDNKPLYFDDDHLSNLGASLVVKQLQNLY